MQTPASRRTRLTKRVVEAATIPPPRPTGAPADTYLRDKDLEGFWLRVRSTGAKTFMLVYRLDGKPHRMVLGQYGELTVEQARQMAMEAKGKVAAARRAGLADPLEERRRARIAADDRRTAPTVAETADAWLREASAKLKPSTVREYARLLGVVTVKRGPEKGTERPGELRQALGKLKVADVTAAQVAKLHLAMKDRPYQANRALAALSALFTFAERHGARPHGSNPCQHIQPYKEEARERYLTDAEFAALGAALATAERDGLPVPEKRQRRRATAATRKHRTKDTNDDGARAPRRFSPVAIGALRFLLLTGWRKDEAQSLRWDAVDVARGVATLRDSKTGRSVRELGPPALELIEAMRAYRLEGNPYVFPGAKDGDHFKDTARVWDAVRQAAGLPDVRLHDLRHAFASVAASGGLTLPVIGALLGHGHSATTSRYAHLVDSARKRAAESTSAAVAAALAAGVATASAPASADVLPFKRRGA